MPGLQHAFTNSQGVKIHYVTAGEGPLVLMIHGFPDFWYSWRHQLEALAPDFCVAAMDQRGYNDSGKPHGQEQYDLALLAGDVEAVIKTLGREKAVIMGHDWGGAVAWHLAMFRPELVDRLIVLALPHPKLLARELANNPEQQANSAYARAFQQPGAHEALDMRRLAKLVAKDRDTREKYMAAFEASDPEAMLHYYKQNYPREPYREIAGDMPKVKCPVLLFHGLKDRALHRNALSGTWDLVESDLTIVTLPDADHWVHHDEADLVSGTIRDWLMRHGR